ncbi:zinc-binding dehydrogenase [Nocardioides bigeumensis]|uniref:Zinc-binding dehydrogenase n=1 Tax=Nocardioides bigeumensis TaxID=433657 RepID=A0ABP5JZ90_9ACTN
MPTAVRFTAPGPPSVLRPVTVLETGPSAGEVLVEIRATAVNHLDLDERDGTSGFDVTPTGQLGREGAGVVSELGPGARGWRVGDRVIVSAYPPCGSCPPCGRGWINVCERPRRPGIDTPGTYAESLVVPDRALFALPDDVDLAQGACLQLGFGTAWHGLLTRGRLRAGETVLVTGAGGGVGSAAVQVARLAGARVVAAASTVARQELARDCGADAVVDSGTVEILAAEVREVTGGAGVDVVFDAAAGEHLRVLIDLLRVGGRYVLYGAHAGQHAGIDALALFRQYVEIVASRGWQLPDIRGVIDAVEVGRLRTRIDRQLRLSEAAQAHELLARRQVTGKVVLIP